MINNSISQQDIQDIEKCFFKNYTLYEINFLNIYTVPAPFIMFLYEQIEILKQNVSISINKNRLSKYFHQLGFQSNFLSQLTKKQVNNPNKNVIAIGGSANSTKKIIEILKDIDTLKFTTFLIQHVSPNTSSIFDSLLQNYVEARIVYAKNGMHIQEGYVYIAPADKHLEVVHNIIYLNKSEVVNFARPSISVSFNSLAQEYQDNILFILECGYGEDGVDALESLTKIGSTIIIQNPKECKADQIPLSALKKRNSYNFMLNVHEIIMYVDLMALKFETSFELIEYLFLQIYKKYEYDFRSYQKEYTIRRLKAFMIKHSIRDIKSAVVLIIFNKIAFKSFFLDLSINVTEFFREEKSLKRMKTILQTQYKNNYKIKIWSAGCSNGKEVYSMNIILDKLGLLNKSLIYATDFNPIVIEEAKNGIYSLQNLNSLKEKYKNIFQEDLIDESFDINNKFIKVKDKVKKNTLFFTHNLEKDSVFNEFDIIECKNVLIYFNDELKQKIFNLFYESLKFGGYLCLGSSELLHKEFYEKFNKQDEQYNIYKKVA